MQSRDTLPKKKKVYANEKKDGKTELLAKLKTRKGGLGKNERLGGEPARVIQEKIRDLKKKNIFASR